MKQSNIDLNNLKTLVDVVAAGSFAAAARDQGVPPNKLSRQVQRLEKELDVRLLQRTTRRLGLTSSGRELVEASRLPLEQLNQSLQEASSQAKEARGHLRIAAPSDFFSLARADRIAQFLGQYPGISIEFLLSDEHVDLIASGVDLAVRGGVVRDETLIARPLTQTSVIIVASPECVALHGEPKTPQALQDYPCLAARGHQGRTTWQLGKV